MQMSARLSSPTFILPDLSIPRAIPTGPPYPARANYDVTHKYSRLETRLQAAVHALSKRVAVNASSRVARMAADVERLRRANKRVVLEGIAANIRDGQWSHPFRDPFLALQESRTFIEVIEQLLPYLTDTQLRELVKGHPDPAKDSSSSRSRNKEFEW